MESGDEGGEFILLHILEFVDEERESCARRLGGCTRNIQQVLQVVLKIAVVRQAGLGIEIQAHFDILIFDLGGPVS